MYFPFIAQLPPSNPRKSKSSKKHNNNNQLQIWRKTGKGIIKPHTVFSMCVENRCNGKKANANRSHSFQSQQTKRRLFMYTLVRSNCVPYASKFTTNRFFIQKSTPDIFLFFSFLNLPLCFWATVFRSQYQKICNGAKNFRWLIINFRNSIFIQHIACLYHKSNKHFSITNNKKYWTFSANFFFVLFSAQIECSFHCNLLLQ